MKYRVTITRTGPRSHDFEVEADSPEEADDLANEEACNFDFHEAREGEPRYETTSIIPIA